MEDDAGQDATTSRGGDRDPADRYPSVQRRSHEWRSRRANAIAALALIGGIALAVLLLALFA